MFKFFAVLAQSVYGIACIANLINSVLYGEVMDKKQRSARILGLLRKNYPKPEIALRYDNPVQLLVSVILSAQCTDKRVNMVTADLFRKYRTVVDFANADQGQFEREIRSTGFYRNKAKNIIASAGIIQKDFGGKVPDTMEDLLKLPGVARKTANVVLSALYGKLEGCCVDTHVRRLSQRWHLTKNSDPNKIELDLMEIIPRRFWEKFSLMTIKHGREVCFARKPDCGRCFMNRICPSAYKA